MPSAVVVILGRTNVGKSSLFNRLTGGKEALVGEEAGLTRDLRFGLLASEAKKSRRAADDAASHDPDDDKPVRKEPTTQLVIVDTGGLQAQATAVQVSSAQQAWMQAEKADLVLLLTDATVGPTGFDEEVLSRLRRQGRPLLLVTNKVDRAKISRIEPDHAALGLGAPMPISARTGRGTALLRRRLQDMAGQLENLSDEGEEPAHPGNGCIVLTGRPNAGKSTLLNALCGRERALVADEPGTTRDDVVVQLEQDGAQYSLIDTAGVQRKWRLAPPSHALAAARSLTRLRRALVVVHLVDAEVGLTGQDQRLIGQALEEGRALLVAYNKTDNLDAARRRELAGRPERRLEFAPFIPRCMISARNGEGLRALRNQMFQLAADSERTAGTAQVNRILQHLLEQHPPPTQRGRRPKLRYAHPVSGNPLQIRIFGTACERVPDSYKRYLEKAFGQELGGQGQPVRISLRSVNNPYITRRR